ncbi:hypothetical protein GCM10010103_56810 [Streptomyces paradoxus]
MLWATHDDMAGLYGDVLGVGRDGAGDRLEGGPIDSGHHMSQEAPDALAAALLGFRGNGPDGDTVDSGQAVRACSVVAWQGMRVSTPTSSRTRRTDL